jgi:hypothetical protein
MEEVVALVAKNPRSAVQLVVAETDAVHPSARVAMAASPARPAPLAVGNHFFLKNPNFGFGFCGAATSAVIHSRNTAASHVI